MMVDGAVVMVENIHRHLTGKPADGKHPRANKIETVLYAAKEVGRPIVFGIFIIIVVFLPLFTLEGFEGKMFAPLAFTISFALLGSLILSITLVPMLCTYFLKQTPLEHDPRHIRWLKHVYLKGLAPCVRHPWRVVLPSVAALAGSGPFPLIGTEFLPTLDEAPSRSRHSASRAFPSRNPWRCRRAEKILKGFPEVIDVVSKTGRADIASDPMGVEISDVIVTLKPREEWKDGGTKEELVEKMREALETSSRRGIQLFPTDRLAGR